MTPNSEVPESPPAPPPKTSRTIIVHFIPSLAAEPLVLDIKDGEKAGYRIQSDDGGNACGYRLYVGDKTNHIPFVQVLRIETNL